MYSLERRLAKLEAVSGTGDAGDWRKRAERIEALLRQMAQVGLLPDGKPASSAEEAEAWHEAAEAVMADLKREWADKVPGW